MMQSRLAQELRERQYKLQQVPRAAIDMLSDDEMIGSYITCSHCGEKQVDEKQLEAAILQAKDADSFFAICDQATSHQHP